MKITRFFTLFLRDTYDSRAIFRDSGADKAGLS